MPVHDYNKLPWLLRSAGIHQENTIESLGLVLVAAAHSAPVPVPSWHRQSPACRAALSSSRASCLRPRCHFPGDICLPALALLQLIPGHFPLQAAPSACSQGLWHGPGSTGTADPCATEGCHVAPGVASEMEEVATARMSSCHSSCISVAAAGGEQNPPGHSAGSWVPWG